MTAPRVSLADRVAVVTGSANGMGRVFALDLAARGAAVVVADIDPEVDAVAGEIEASGGAALAVCASVADPQGAVGIVDLAIERFGRVDVVINNAGVTHYTLFPETDEALIDHHLALSARGSFLITQRAFTGMAARGYGRVVFISSATGVFGRPRGSAYATGKMGMIGLMNVLALEGAEHGILANAVLPVARTDIATRATVAPGADRPPGPAAFTDPRFDPSYVSPLVVFLASEACTVSHGIYSAVAGRYARVFVGVGEGWRAGSAPAPTADDLAAHFDEIGSPSGLTFPGSVAEEQAGALGEPPAPP